jgi:hypothetical protein
MTCGESFSGTICNHCGASIGAMSRVLLECAESVGTATQADYCLVIVGSRGRHASALSIGADLADAHDRAVVLQSISMHVLDVAEKLNSSALIVAKRNEEN